MAFTGLVLLILFVIGAVGAPLFTPYDPNGSVVTSPLARPGWMPLVTGPVGWSQNIAFTGLSASGSGLSITPTVTSTSSIDVQVNSNSQGGTIVVQKSMHYPYQAEAQVFVGNAIVKVPGLTNTKVNVTLSIVDVTSNQPYPLWTASLHPSTPGREVPENTPTDSISSYTQPLNQRLGFPSSQAAKLIFNKPGDFQYALALALPAGVSGLTFTIRDFRLQLYGNAWGPLGADNVGRDIWTQLLYGARLSLEVGLLATFIGVGLGLVVGLLAGYLGKIVDEALMRFTDMMLVIPGLPLLIVLATVLGSSLFNIIIILGFLGWMGFARLVRAQVLSLRERPFIEAAKASGAGTGYTLVRHIMPNVVSLTYVNLALSVPAAIVGEAALSFLGLGDETVITWGRMLSLANTSAGTATNLPWWWVIPPGIAIALVSLSFILIGYSLDEIFNPRLRRRR